MYHIASKYLATFDTSLGRWSQDVKGNPTNIRNTPTTSHICFDHSITFWFSHTGKRTQANAQILYAEGIEMALEQLRGGDPGTASSREELSVLRGVAEELGLLGGAEAVRNFAAAFGVKQVLCRIESPCYLMR